MIGAGAKVLGSITIGDNSKIGAGSVVLKDIPPDATVVGVSGKVVKRGNRRISQEEMDQVYLPESVRSDISALKIENHNLKQGLDELETMLYEIKNIDKEEQGDIENELGLRNNVCCIFKEVSKTAS